MSNLIKEIKSLIADKLIYWAFRLDPDRYIEKKSNLDLDAMRKRLDEVLANETDESLREWLRKEREGRECKINTQNIGLPSDKFTIH